MADELRGTAYLGALVATAAAGVLLAVAVWGALGLGPVEPATAAPPVGDRPAPSAAVVVARPASAADDVADQAAPPTWIHDPGPGTCVRTGEDNRRAPDLVACDEPHDLEVVAVIDPAGAPELATADDAGPSTQQWAATLERCRAALRAERGARFDPDGQHVAVVSFPLPSQWRAGDRRAECNVAVRPAPGGRWPMVEGSWRDRDDLPALEVGDCARGVGPADALLTVVVPVPCAEPHEVEVVARVVVPTGRSDGSSAAADERCAGAATAYLGGPLSSDGERRAADPASVAPALDAVVLPVSDASRLAGRDTTFCALVTFDAARSRPVAVTGRR